MVYLDKFTAATLYGAISREGEEVQNKAAKVKSVLKSPLHLSRVNHTL